MRTAEQNGARWGGSRNEPDYRPDSFPPRSASSHILDHRFDSRTVLDVRVAEMADCPIDDVLSTDLREARADPPNQALSICSSAGASELGDFRASSLTTLLSMVASGAGVTLLPKLATHDSFAIDRDLSLVPFARPVPKRTIGFAWRKTSPRGGEFAELARLFESGVR